MSDNRDIIQFGGTGLDTDSDLLAIGKGDSRYRLNVVTSGDGNNDVLTNLLGNTKREYALLPQGSKVVGSVEDKENDAVIYFVYSNVNDHAILRYNSALDTFTSIISMDSYYTDTSALNIPESSYIDAGIIGNEDDQFLVWTDGDFPKMINIKHAIDGNYNADLTEDEISFYKKPFTGSIFASYDNTGVKSDVINRVFQFSVRYRYYDKTVSTISPISEIAEPTNNMSSGRVYQGDADNHINVTITDLLGDDTIIESYELLYRLADIGDGAVGSWYVYGRYDFSSTISVTIDFKNNKSLGIVSDEEASRPYDFVPDKANHLAVINSNIAVFDVAQEGYDNIAIPSGEEPSVLVVETEVDASDSEIKYESLQTASSGVNAVFTYVNANTSLDYDWIFSVNDQVAGSVTEEGITVSSYNLQSTEVFDLLVDFVTNLGLTGLSASRVGSTMTVVSTTNNYYVSLLIIDKSSTYKSLKTKTSYKYGIRYGYGGKVGTVQSFDDLEFITFDNDTLTTTGTNYKLGATVSLEHQAPEGATDYQIVSFGSNVNYYEEYFVRCNDDDLTDSSNEYTIYIDESDTVIKRDEMVNRFKAAYSSGGSGTDVDPYFGINYGFDVNIGDEIRFVAVWENAPLAGNLNPPPFRYEDEYSYIVKSVSSTEIRLSSSALITAVEKYPASAGVTKEYFLIQIIRKNQNFSAIAQEFSPVYKISNRNHLGVGSDTDQSYPGTAASLDVTEYFGDVWKSKQVFVNYKNVSDYGLLTLTYYSSWMEKPRVSLYYDSYPTFYGRVNAVNENAEQRGDQKIRWGGQFLDESGANFMTKFEGGNEAFVDDRNGLITKIQQIGDTLKVYQERKVTSFYLNKKSSTDRDGNTTMLYSDVIIDPNGGSQSAFDNGCTNFESYVKNLKHTYFFDVINGDVVRDSQAGLEEVSNYGMHTYFKDKAKQVLVLGRDNVKVLGTYDDDNDLYIISFVYPTDTSNAVNDSIAFHEPSNKWMTFLSLPTSPLDYYARLSGKTHISFLGGEVYVHNNNTTRNNLWGSQEESVVMVHSNLNPNLIKVWDNVEIVSTGQWAPDEDGDVKVNIPSEQQSRLKKGKFELQEGEYRTEFLRDMLSGASTPQEDNLFNGEAMRGYDITLELRNDDTTEANLRLVKINGTTST